jgi:hypothetical protein
MSSAEITSNTNINPIEFNPRNIHRQFSQTPEGVKLANNTRFSIFQGDLDNNTWQKLLGYDVNNLEHGRLVYETTRLFIKHMNSSSEFFNPEEEKLLLLTSIIHDYPEGFTSKGDVNYEVKKEQDEDNELTFINQIIINISGQENLNLSIEIKDILKNKNSKLGQFFNAIEKTGYLRTGLNAWKKSKVTTKPTSSNLVLLTNNVLLNQIPKLIEYASLYPPVNSFLKRKQKIISETFETMPNSIFDKYKPEDKETYILKFNYTQTRWSDWINK